MVHDDSMQGALRRGWNDYSAATGEIMDRPGLLWGQYFAPAICPARPGGAGLIVSDCSLIGNRRFPARRPIRIALFSGNMAVGMEERLIDIELKLTAQEDLVLELNQRVYEQQKQIDELRALCTALVKRLGEAANEGGADPYAVEKPPHY